MTINPLNELEAIAQTLASLSASMEKDLGDLPYSRISGYITQTNNLADDIFHEISVLRERQGEEQVRAYVSGNADGYMLAKQTIEAEQSELFEAEQEAASEQLEADHALPPAVDDVVAEEPSELFEVQPVEEAPALNADMQDEREQPVEGYAPVTNPEADQVVSAMSWYSPKEIAERHKVDVFALFRREKEDA